MMRPVQQWLPFQKIPRASGLGLADSSASSSSAQSWVPDVYTPPFVSDYQRSINTMDAVTIRALHPPEVNFARFVEQFSGRGFLAPLKPVPRLYAAETGIDRLRGGAIPIVNPVSGERVGKKKRKGRAAGPRKELEPVETFELGPGNYEDHFSKLLRVEIETDDQLIQTYNMYSVSVIPQDVTQSLYQVFTPGIRENTPHVQLGDMIKLRQIRPMSYHGAFTGYEYETYIYGMDKSVGYVVLRADGLWIEVGGKFNVIFGVQEHRWDSARRAISDVGRALKPLDRSEERPKEETPKDAQESQFLRRMLFPEKSDGVMQYGLSRGVFSRSWIDAELNYEQVGFQCYFP